MSWLIALAGVVFGFVLAPVLAWIYFVPYRGFVKGKGWGPDDL